MKIKATFLLALLGQATSGAVLAAEPPAAMMDFDRQMSFSRPMFVSVFRGYNDDHTYYVLPNSVTLKEANGGVPELSLVYESIKQRRNALLSVKGTVAYGRDYAEALDEIKSMDPQARFAMPQPYSFQFRLMTPSSDGQGAVIEGSKIGSAGQFELIARVSDITSRILLLPNSYKFEFMSVVYAPTYRGIVRDDDGTVKIRDRSFEVGVVSNGGCAFNPDTYVGWPSNRSGCMFPKYDPVLVRGLQKNLHRLGLYKSGIDGIYGPATGQAIRSFQKSKTLPEDGIPSAQLLALLSEAAA
ncbi:peptidoglycan-binding domain-containing protein [Bradyrhizobium sp. HKCCYLRH2015]|uniref:peptidoglycan-binding domain-containing protein n=1 Tax=Bradyrhizobium TaxID=374 RepID=UPI003EBE0D8E